MPLFHIDPNARLGRPPCDECHLEDGEICDICHAYQLRSTKGIRERCRELTRTDGHDDYDRAVLCVLDDLEALLKAYR